jgi:hypothetical protein
MLNRDFDITATIHSTATALRDAVTRTEALAVDAVARTAGVLPNVQEGLNKTRALGGAIVGGLDESGRAVASGVTEIAGKLAEHGRLAVADTVELVRATARPDCLGSLVAAHAGYAGRRGLAVFQIVDDLNASGRTHTLAAWSPVAEAIDGLSRLASDGAGVKAAPAARPNKAAGKKAR